MAGDINSVVVVGRLVRDSELRYTASGTAICNFSIAVNRRVKKGDQWSDEASFFDLTLFDKTAENLNKYLVKGTQVAVQGELRQERWEKDGKTMSKVVVHPLSVQLIGGNRESRPNSDQGQAYTGAPGPGSGARGEDGPGAYEDDIPFAPHRM